MDPREIVTVPCRVIKELAASWILAGERVTVQCYSSVPRQKGEGHRNLGVQRAFGKDGQRTGFQNCTRYERPIPFRVPKSKVITVGHGTATMPRWIAVQANLL